MLSLRKSIQRCAATNCFDVGAIMLCVAWAWGVHRVLRWFLCILYFTPAVLGISRDGC